MSLELGRYKHFKGNEYEVIGMAKDSETLEPVVLYQATYGDHAIWVRPLTSFMETVVVEGVTKPRFEKLETID